MLLRLHYFLRLLLFWLILFTSFRLLFILFNPDITFHAPLTVVLQSFIAGIRLDLSTIAYLAFPVYFFWLAFLFIRKEWINRINRYYHDLLLFGLCLLYVGSLKMYHEWGTLLTYAVFDYLADPAEVISFISYAQLSFLILFLILYFLAAIWLFRKMLLRFTFQPGKIFQKTGIALFIPFALGFFARGGLQLAPINESSAYYSDIPFFNHVAVNPFWYFIHSYLERDPTHNAYEFMPREEAEERNRKLFAVADSTQEQVIRLNRPNIVLIILESWTADIIESLGGEPGITDRFDSLRKEGLLFSNIYNSGSRTEHGLVSIMSGYPPSPQISIITKPNKSQKLSNINNVLNKDGYSSSFYYGGEIGFVNMKSFLLNAHVQKIVDRDQFTEEQCNSKWGAHDQYVYDRQLADLQQAKEPFFSVVLTLSSHEPFDVPMKTPYIDHDEPNRFRSAAWYADQCLGEYFRKAKQQPWYANTLFVLVADHGHRLPRNTDFNFPVTKHIPLLFLGGALKEEYKGKINPVIGNQHDIVSTLLHQLGEDATAFSRSKDLLHTNTHPFAYYVNNNVLGWITPEQTLIYVFASHELKKLNSNSDPLRDDSIFLDAKAYLQTHYQDYLDY